MPFYSTTATTTCWTIWSDTTATTATNCVQQAWFQTTNSTMLNAQSPFAQQPPPTPEELAERALRDAEWREKEKQRAAVREAANQRAEELLLEYLNPEQATCYRKNRHFDIRARSGQRYRIHGDRGLVGNVHVLNDDGKVHHRLCAHDRVVGVPMGDQLLMQKLMLEVRERDFLSVANVH